MNVTVEDIAKMLDAEVEGDPSTPILGPAKIEEGQPGLLTFLANPKYEHYVYNTPASAILVGRDFHPAKPVTAVLIRVDDVYASVGRLLAWYEEQQGQQSTDEFHEDHIHPSALVPDSVKVGPLSIIKEGAELGEDCVLYGQVYIGARVKIGKRCTFHPGVRIMHETIIGDDCTFYPNAVVGSDGFGYAREADGYSKIPQIGIVRIGNKTEIGAGTTIDRAVMGETVVGDGVIIDNLVHLGHNVTIGDHTAIAAQTGIAGSTKVGKNCIIGGQVGIAGHITIADGTMIQAKSGVSKKVKAENSKLYGYPAFEYGAYLKSYAHFKQLPDIKATMKALQERIEELENKLSE